MNSFNEVIIIACNILFPDDYSILRFSYSGPLSVNCGSTGKLASEIKFITFCACCVCIPSAEFISVSYHIQKAFVACGFSGFIESGSVISSAFAVLVKYQPVSLGSVDREFYISWNVKVCFIWIIIYSLLANCHCLCAGRETNNIARTVCHDPAFQIMCGVCRVCHVDCISSWVFSAWNFNNCRSDSDFIAVNVWDIELFEYCSIVGNFCVCC